MNNPSSFDIVLVVLLSGLAASAISYLFFFVGAVFDARRYSASKGIESGEPKRFVDYYKTPLNIAALCGVIVGIVTFWVKIDDILLRPPLLGPSAAGDGFFSSVLVIVGTAVALLGLVPLVLKTIAEWGK